MAIYDYELQHLLMGYVPCPINGLKMNPFVVQTHHTGVVKTNPLNNKLPSMCRVNTTIYSEVAEVITLHRRMRLSPMCDIVNLDLTLYGYRQFAGIVLGIGDFTTCVRHLCPSDIYGIIDTNVEEFDSSYTIHNGVKIMHVNLKPTREDDMNMLSQMRLGYTYIEHVEVRPYISNRDFNHGVLAAEGTSEKLVTAHIYTAAATDSHRYPIHMVKLQKDNIITKLIATDAEDEYLKNLFDKISSSSVVKTKDCTLMRDRALHISDEDYIGKKVHWDSPYTKMRSLRMDKNAHNEITQKQMTLTGRVSVRDRSGLKTPNINYSKIHNYLYNLDNYNGGLLYELHTQHLCETSIKQDDYRFHSECFSRLLVSYMKLTKKPILSVPYVVREYSYNLPKLFNGVVP